MYKGMSNAIKGKGKWEMVDGEWCVSVRVTGADRSGLAALAGAAVPVQKKDRSIDMVYLGAVVRDYGDGDVTIFAKG